MDQNLERVGTKPIAKITYSKNRNYLMDDVLEDIKLKNTHKKYSKLSLFTAAVLLGLAIYIFVSIPQTLNAKQDIPTPPEFIIYIIHIFCLSGVILTILSFVFKEPPSWMKYIGGAINSLIFLIIWGSILFSKLI